ncbi:hypothetical protein TNIN_454801 [Trichonephila inaurata madagascariensis]|uniref:Uncharacterized protein n=1 Tax=Trichonephila inaurata madagascariensis TaxID=2747483 RepID=A0A8X6XZR0_9ARAC|nr:hypothetical protein TNIN_454801 [Trichonephila inaurata madagascariensis]
MGSSQTVTGELKAAQGQLIDENGSSLYRNVKVVLHMLHNGQTERHQMDLQKRVSSHSRTVTVFFSPYFGMRLFQTVVNDNFERQKEPARPSPLVLDG